MDTTQPELPDTRATWSDLAHRWRWLSPAQRTEVEAAVDELRRAELRLHAALFGVTSPVVFQVVYLEAR